MADLGWHLNRDVAELASDVTARVETLAVPFLDAFDSRDKIIGEWTNFTDRFLPSEGRARIVVAIILARLLRTAEATALLAEHLALRQHDARHAKYVHEIAAKLGLPALPVS